jgi:hydrogenase maturation protease
MEENGLVEKNKSLLVLGVGNFLCCDDGIGSVLAENLIPVYNDHPEIEVINGGTIGIGLLYLLENYQSILFVDAIDIGATPGDVFRYKLEDLAMSDDFNKLSAHQSNPPELISYAQVLGCLPDNVELLGIQVDTICPQIGLSDTLTRKLDTIELKVREEIKEYLERCTN